MADITDDEINSAIRRTLLNGERWEMGDIVSETSLKNLLALRDQVKSQNDGMSLNVVVFANPTTSGS